MFSLQPLSVCVNGDRFTVNLNVFCGQRCFSHLVKKRVSDVKKKRGVQNSAALCDSSSCFDNPVRFVYLIFPIEKARG